MKKRMILLSAATLLSLAACGGHTHTFASEWTYDDTNHWHAATCEHTDQKDGVAAHTMGEDGKCTVCDYQQQPSYTKMTEEQFNALVNKIQTQGIAAQFDLLAKAGDVVLAKEKASFKFDIASTSLEELSYNDTGAVVDGSILKDLAEYEFKSGEWVIRGTLTEQQAKQTLGHELEGMCEQFFPSQTYADYSFDETTGKYTVDFTNEQQLHIVFVYTMDANGITKIEGTTSGEYEGVNVVSTVNTSSVNVGPQTIVKPDVPEIPEGNMSKQDFDALVNGINTIGFKYECDVTQSANDEEIYSGGIEDIFNSKVHAYNLFSYEGKNNKLRNILADRKLCRQENNNTWKLVTRYETDKEALEDWTAKKEERLTYVLPSLNFADYVYDEDKETYSISKTVHIYENDFVIRATVDMDKEGINSTYGTLTYETKDLKIVYTFDTTEIVIGEYEITSPIL